jgi:hypothetical protein
MSHFVTAMYAKAGAAIRLGALVEAREPVGAQAHHGIHEADRAHRPRFIAHNPVEPLRPWDGSNWGTYRLPK